MKIGRFTFSAASLALLVFQLAIVSTIAAKYLYQRWSCPRVWTRAAAIALVIALPWCYSATTESYHYVGGASGTYTITSPNLLAHALVAAFAVFLCWWGVRMLSRALVNLGIMGFAGAVGWFYFSDIYNDHERALGLIGLGVLFLAGGWALEKMRRRILARMAPPPQFAAAAAPSGKGGAQ